MMEYLSYYCKTHIKVNKKAPFGAFCFTRRLRTFSMLQPLQQYPLWTESQAWLGTEEFHDWHHSAWNDIHRLGYYVCHELALKEFPWPG